MAGRHALGASTSLAGAVDPGKGSRADSSPPRERSELVLRRPPTGKARLGAAVGRAEVLRWLAEGREGGRLDARQCAYVDGREREDRASPTGTKAPMDEFRGTREERAREHREWRATRSWNMGRGAASRGHSEAEASCCLSAARATPSDVSGTLRPLEHIPTAMLTSSECSW